jgi:hypothetical protein
VATGERRDLVVLGDATGPADPRALVLDEHRMQCGHEAARAASPGAPRLGNDLVNRESIRDDDERTHARLLVES